MYLSTIPSLRPTYNQILLLEQLISLFSEGEKIFIFYTDKVLFIYFRSSRRDLARWEIPFFVLIGGSWKSQVSEITQIVSTKWARLRL
jgi:hypothetical protein